MANYENYGVSLRTPDKGGHQFFMTKPGCFRCAQLPFFDPKPPGALRVDQTFSDEMVSRPPGVLVGPAAHKVLRAFTPAPRFVLACGSRNGLFIF